MKDSAIILDLPKSKAYNTFKNQLWDVFIVCYRTILLKTSYGMKDPLDSLLFFWQKVQYFYKPDVG